MSQTFGTHQSGVVQGRDVFNMPGFGLTGRQRAASFRKLSITIVSRSGEMEIMEAREPHSFELIRAVRFQFQLDHKFDEIDRGASLLTASIASGGSQALWRQGAMKIRKSICYFFMFAGTPAVPTADATPAG